MTFSSLRSKESKRAARHRSFAKARKLYALLLRLVGGPSPHCAWCKRNETECELTLDHMNGKDWRANTIRMDERIKRYRDEFKRGVKFQLLCRECNSKDGRARQLEGRVSAVVEAKAVSAKKRIERRLACDSCGATDPAKCDCAGNIDRLFDEVPF